MEINDLHQILAELETNLKDLDSARKQVESVTQNSNNVNNSTKELIEKLEDFIQLIGNNTFEFADGFSKSLSSFKSELENFINSSKEQTNKENKRIRELTSAFISAIDDNFDSFNAKSEQTFKGLSDDLKNISSSFEKATKDQISIVNEVSKSINSLMEVQKNEFKSLKQEFINECKKQNKTNFYLLVGIIILIISNIIIYFVK